MPSDVRIAWFSPLPPIRSGIATYSAAIVPRLSGTHAIDCFSEENARDFVWQARCDPYDLVVYQLGNAPGHDFMWGYLAAYPGLVVLHDARLHHARARPSPAGAFGRLPARVLVRPSTGPARFRRVRGGGPRRP